MFMENKDYSSCGKYVYNEAEFNKYIHAEEFFEKIKKYGAE